MATPEPIVVGNAGRDGRDRRGWFLGHMIADEDDPRHSRDVEVKWGEHPAGEPRRSWVANRHATTMSVLIRGRFLVRFEDRDVLLSEEGDYVLWAAGVAHTWEAVEDSVVLTVRWPSLERDSVPIDPPDTFEEDRP